MRNFGILATGFFVLLVAAACAPMTEPGQTVEVSAASSQAAVGETSAPSSENIAVVGTGHSLSRSEFAHLAIDGDPETSWNSEQFAPQWFSIVFDEPYLVSRIEMVVTQLPAGPTVHELWLGDEPGRRVLYKRLRNANTEDGQTLEVAIDPPRSISEVLIHTRSSPSWVAWREVRVLGAPSAGSLEAEEADPSERVAMTAEPEGSASELSTQTVGNVAPQGSGFASAEAELARFAIDNDPSTIWNSQSLPPQWLSVALDNLYLVTKIEMVVALAVSGPTTNEVWLGDGLGARTLYKRFSDLHTADEQILEVIVDPPRRVSELLLLTLDSPSRVAWREVRVLGAPSENQIEEAEPPQLNLNQMTTGLELPVQVTHAGDGSGRIFVTEQKGRVRIVRDGIVDDTPLLDISERVTCCGEQGLLNVAFPPGYAAKQYFYVSYTNRDGVTVFSRFTTTSDPDRADPDSEEVLLTIEQPHENHNGGRMAFGPDDGYLYIGSGDGGEIGVVVTTGQEPDSLLGKILRIDVGSGVKPYSIPPDNPFSRNASYFSEIWALGLRNPWGFAFDRESGDRYIPDVGDTRHEEINFQPASGAGGRNYGWPVMEGNVCYVILHSSCRADGLTLPVAVYDHAQGCAIVGGVVYRGTKHPQLQGAFVFGDFCSGRIWVLKRIRADSRDTMQDIWQSELLLHAKSAIPLSKIGEDEDGNIYAIGYLAGALFEITER